MRLYRFVSLVLSVSFLLVGILFLVSPNAVLIFFNNISPHVGMPVAPLAGLNFYLVLSVAYMYLVTVLAFMMYRRPKAKHPPFMLMNAKFASSIVSLTLFLLGSRYLIYVVNFLIDGTIGFIVLYLYLKTREVSL